MMTPSRIILVDDDQDDGFVFGIALESLSQKVEFMHIEDSEVAIKMLSDASFKPPDFLFLDWNMPKLDGRQCLLLIRSFPQYATIPIVIYSTAKDNKLNEEACSLGASAFMPKPSSISDLVIKLESYFKSHKAKLNAEL